MTTSAAATQREEGELQSGDLPVHAIIFHLVVMEERAPAFGAGAEIRRTAGGAGRVLGEPQIGAVAGPLALRPDRQAFSARVACLDEIGPE